MSLIGIVGNMQGIFTYSFVIQVKQIARAELEVKIDSQKKDLYT